LNEDLLIKGCQRGRRKDFEELIGRYYYPLLKFFSKYDVNKQTCEDLTHDTILKMIENIEKYKVVGNAKFSTWLFTIAYNTLLNYVSKISNKNGEESLTEIESVIPSGRSTEDEALRNIDSNDVKLKVDSLSIEDKALINLRYIHGFGYKDISQVMNMPEKAVKWKLHDALERLRKLFIKEARADELSEV